METEDNVNTFEEGSNRNNQNEQTFDADKTFDGEQSVENVSADNEKYLDAEGKSGSDQENGVSVQNDREDHSEPIPDSNDNTLNDVPSPSGDDLYAGGEAERLEIGNISGATDDGAQEDAMASQPEIQNETETEETLGIKIVPVGGENIADDADSEIPDGNETNFRPDSADSDSYRDETDNTENGSSDIDVMDFVRDPFRDSNDFLENDYGDSGVTLSDAIRDGNITYDQAVGMFAEAILESADEVMQNDSFPERFSSLEETVGVVFKENESGPSSFLEDIASKVDDMADGNTTVLDAMDAVSDTFSFGTEAGMPVDYDETVYDPVDMSTVYNEVLNDATEPDGFVDQGIDAAFSFQNDQPNDLEQTISDDISADTAQDMAKDTAADDMTQSMQDDVSNGLDHGVENEGHPEKDPASRLTVSDGTEQTGRDEASDGVDAYLPY